MERYVQSLIADSNKSMLREAEEMWASRRSPEERKRDSMMKAAAGMSPERRRKYYQQYGMSPEKYVQYQFGKANALAERRKRIRAQQAAALMREQRVRWNEAREARSLSLQNARVETIKKEEEWFSGFREVEGRYPSGGETRWRRQQAEREKAFNPMSVPRTKYSPFPSEQRKN
jgi:hypothetical protein